jgi:hypothetical protein
MLSTVPALYTLNHSGRPYPGSISDLAATEIEAVWKLGGSDRGSIREYVRDRIYPLKLEPNGEDTKALFENSRRIAEKNSFLSAFSASPMNPYLNTPLSKLGGLVLNSLGPPGLPKFTQDFTNALGTKGVTPEQTESFVNFFLSQFATVQASTPHGISIPQWVAKLAREELDLEKTLGHYLEIYYLKLQLLNASKITSIPSADLEAKVRWSDVHTIRLGSCLQSELQTLQTSDVRRPIETSSMADIHLAAYSLFVETFVDKRTLDLVRRANAQLNYNLALRRVTYVIP